MPHLYLTSWTQTTDPELGSRGWVPPSRHVVGSIDMRPLASEPGVGLFTLSQQDGNLDGHIGEFTPGTLDSHIDRAVVDAVEQRLNLSAGTIRSDTARGLVAELLTQHSDPTGENRWKPLIPTKGGSLEIHLGGLGRIVRERFNINTHSHRDKVLAGRRLAYRRLREEFRARYQDGDPRREHYLRVLDAWRQKYRVSDYRVFVPDDLPDEGVLPRSTTLLDGFNRANQQGLGDSPDGWSWIDGILHAARHDIVDNQCEQADIEASEDASRWSRADSPLSSADHYAQIGIINNPSDTRGRGITIRDDGTGEHGNGDSNLYDIFYANESWSTRKFVNANITNIGSATSLALTLGDVIKGEADGSNIIRYRNGSVQDTATDMSLDDLFITGITSSRALQQLDGFEASDGAAAAGRSQAVLIT